MNLKYLILIFLLFSVSIFAQNPKKLYKNGNKLIETNQFEEAIFQYSKAVDINPQYSEAYIARAEAYKKINRIDLAAKDYAKAAELNPNIVDYYFLAGKAYYKIKDYDNALKYLSETVILDKNYFQAYQYKSFAHIKSKQYKEAVVSINKALDIKPSFLGYYAKAIAYDSLKSYPLAIDNYKKALELKPESRKAYFALTKVYIKSNNFQKALELANITVRKFPNAPESYKNRSKVYYHLSKYPNAINDLSKLETLINDQQQILFKRGIYYFKYKQFQNAKSDFTQFIALSHDNYYALYWRARCNEAIFEQNDAVKDYKTFIYLSEQNNAITTNNYKDAVNRLYKLNKENNPPVIVIDTPKIIKPNYLTVINNADVITIKGKVNDKSKIEYLKINGENVVLNDNNFSYDINISNLALVTVTASDVYNNTAVAEYKLANIENTPPVVNILSPYADDDNEIYLNSSDNNLFVEGFIKDNSKIKGVFIDSVRATFNNTENNPHFTASVNIKNKKIITVKVTDIYNNTTTAVYTLNREGILISENNPMGKTWFVFIENSNYNTLASLDGPQKDVNLIKSTLSEYEIHNFIHKKNMTKEEMNHFFSIELRDLVKKNNINSLVIWYAGHGKYINKTGYWIPVDAKQDDEFSYFSINTLKAEIQTFNSFLTHILVVTDACESGNAFYLATRSINKHPKCNDAQATQFKSAQVFSSTGYELAADNSMFTRIFAKTLQYNENTCIPIENIVNKVTETMAQEQKQKPKFGKIKGLDDENGTFFFIRK
jgi:tetratricopeptide (TPR) repeat protein